MNYPLISSAMLVVTHSCNLRCRYCFVAKQPACMSYQVAKDTADLLARNASKGNSPPSINFFGGEPMLMWDEIIVPLTKYIRQEYGADFQLAITTNGTLFDAHRLAFMKENHFGMLLSVDGAKSTQDYNRPYASGTGSFEIVSKWFPQLLYDWPNLTFRMTAIPPTCENLFSDIMFAERSGFKNFFVVPNVFEPWSDEAKATIEQQFGMYSEHYIDSFRQGIIPINYSDLDDAFRSINRINNASQNGEFRVDNSCHACGKCGLGSNRFASVHPNGDIYACQEMTSNEGADSLFYIGNIYTGVSDDHRKNLCDLFDSRPVSGTNCAECLYNTICDGGCVANNYMVTGSVSCLPEMYCWWKQIVLGQAIRIMRTLGNERNELFGERWKRLCQR